jgi:short-subunit dehydrogenase
VKTEFQETNDPVFTEGMPKFTWTDPETVAEQTLTAVERGKRSLIPGGLVKRAFFAPSRVTPVKLSLPISRRIFSRELDR